MKLTDVDFSKLAENDRGTLHGGFPVPNSIILDEDGDFSIRWQFGKQAKGNAWQVCFMITQAEPISAFMIFQTAPGPEIVMVEGTENTLTFLKQIFIHKSA